MRSPFCAFRCYLPDLWRLMALVLLLSALLPLAASAQGPGISLAPQALYNGAVKYGEWLPIRVRLENSGADVRGRVQVRIGSAGQRAVTHAQAVELPRGARKDVTLYVLPNTFTRRVTVEFVADGQPRDGEPLRQAEVAVQPVPNIRLVSAAISGGGEGLDALAGLKLTSRRNDSLLVPLTLDTLPERAEGLRTLDVLVITGVDTGGLAPAQQAALTEWVTLGGTLVLGGGPNAARTLTGVPGALQPVRLTGDLALERLTALEQVAGEPIRVAGPFPTAQGVPLPESSVRVEQEGLPLVVGRRVGQGTVLWLALDPALSPFDAWAGAGAFWATLLDEIAPYPFDLPPDVSPRQMSSEQIGYALTNLPSLDLPSLRLLVPLLLVYIVVVGPLNYLVLRWQRRLELGWITIPVVTLLFSAGAYAIGFQLRGGDVIINQVSTIQLQANNQRGASYVRSFVGIFSPARRDYSVELPGDVLVSALNLQGNPFGPDSPAGGGRELLILQGQPTTVQGLSVNQWSMQSFMVESVDPTAAVEAALSTHGATIVGTIKNASNQMWRDAVLAEGSQFQRLGDLAPGQQAEVRLDVGSMRNEGGPPLGWLLFQDRVNELSRTGPPRDVQSKQQILDAIFSGPLGPKGASTSVPGIGPLFIAWADAPPLPVTLPDYRVSHVSTTLVYGRLPLRFGDGEVNLPAGLVTPQIEADGNRYLCYSPRGPGLAPDFDKMSMSFRLPPELHDLQVSELALHISSDGGWFSPPAVQMWAWEQGAWVSAGDDLQIGRNPVAEPARFVRDGVIRLQAVNETRDRGGCIYFDIAVRGVKG
ncbi:MAG TPA: hypothetical protein DEP84_36150 [Chloroflexi bacterium]|nr:hypothetical protein [Chloroflexota bacterium]